MAHFPLHKLYSQYLISSPPLLSVCVSSISSHAAFGFLFSDKCGFSTERLILNKRRDTVENVAGMAFLLAADRVQTGSYIGLDYIIGDTGISQGRWAKKTADTEFSLITNFFLRSEPQCKTHVV